MPRFPYRPIGNNLGRSLRNDWNQNLKDIEADIKELNSAQLGALEAGDYANSQGDYAKGQGNYAKGEGNYAKGEGDYAKSVADSTVASLNSIHDDNTSTTYNWGLKQVGEHVIFMYEEAT